ncbi:sugar kinase [Prolixibacteraceae bacterium JC049]|nr:sugar kinase [Prolixibacteraceae bacterium JC049]
MAKVLFIGLTTIDIQYFVDSFPESNVKVKTATPHIYVGGPATNAAVACSVLGNSVELLSFAGKSAMAEVIHSDLHNYGVKHIDLFPNKHDVPVLASVITSKNNGDRNIFTFNPKDAHFELSSQLNELFDGVDIVFSDGFYPQSALATMKEAQRRSIPTVFDGGSWKQWLPELLPFIDYAICSNDFLPPGCESNESVLNFLDQFNVKYKAISRGGESIVYQVGKNKPKYLPVPNVEVKDTLGAGDFLHGAFCHFIADCTFEESLMNAAKVASLSCQYEGTRTWLKKLK